MNKALVTVILILVVLGGIALWQRPKGTTVDLSNPNGTPGLDVKQIDQATSTSGLQEFKIDTTKGAQNPVKK